MYTATVTQKGQVTIPLFLRTKHHIEPYGKVKIESDNRFIRITAAEDILDLAGTVVPQKGKSALKAREWMGKHYQSR